MRIRRLGLILGLVLAACAAPRGERVATLGEVHADDLPGPGSWLLAATPSILRFDVSRRIEPDLASALVHYEAVAASADTGEGRREALRRAAYLRLQLADERPDPAQQRQAVKNYQELLASHPQDPNRDQVLYQLARAWQSLGDRAAAGDTLRQLLRDVPHSPLAADAAFRLAELDFSLQRYAQAAENYRRVLTEGPAGRFHAMAQYKLGWSAFRLGRHETAVAQFLALLERELPPDAGHLPSEVLDAAPPGRRPWIGDALRVISLSLAAQGGAAAWPRHFATPQAEPAFAPLLHAALGELYLEKRHFTAAAAAFAAFAQRHPAAELAPAFARRQIDSLDAGGFTGPKVRATMDFVDNYAPDASWWQDRGPRPELSAQWRADLDRLAAHFHHQAQQSDAAGRPSARQDYLKAARWYQRRLDWLPQDPDAAQTEFLLAEVLQAAGLADQAIAHFERVAYGAVDFTRSGEAAYAAVLLHFEQAGREAWTDDAAQAAAGRMLARFPRHPQWVAVALRRLEGLLARENWSVLVEQAGPLLARADLAPAQRRQALACMADAHFALADYAAAEQAYRELQGAADAPPAWRENLALSIYRQGERAHADQDPAAAARHFLRVGQLVPGAAIRDEAEFDAAAALLAGEELAAARPVLQALLARAPHHHLAPEARRKLAVVHERLGEPALAAARYREIAAEPGTDRDLAREALWRAATLYGEAERPGPAAEVWAQYVGEYPRPLLPALEARQRLAELAADDDPAAARRWLSALVEAESAAGGARDTASRQLASRAALRLGQQALDRAAGVVLRAPLERSLAARRARLEEGLTWLGRAADAGLADTAPAATYATARGYAELARALLDAPAPAGLDALEEEEFRFLLEEQAYPFEELAIAWHEQNLALLRQDVWDRWIEASAQALGELVPARYAKTERLVEQHATLD